MIFFTPIFELCKLSSSKLPLSSINVMLFPVCLVKVQPSLKGIFFNFSFSDAFVFESHGTKFVAFILVWSQTMLDLISNNNFYFLVSLPKIDFPAVLHVHVFFLCKFDYVLFAFICGKITKWDIIGQKSSKLVCDTMQ